MNPLSPYLIWIKLGAAALAGLAIAAGTWWVTATHYDLKIADLKLLQQAQIIIAQDQAAHRQAAADKITADVNAAAADGRTRQLQQIIANLQRIHQYVTPETDRAFPLPCGFLRLHDAGASAAPAASISLPAGKADADRCDVPTSTAAAIIQSNYGLALGWKAERDSWWDWYAKQSANWNKPPEDSRGNPHG